MDMVGLDLGVAVEGYLWPHLADSTRCSPCSPTRWPGENWGSRPAGVGFHTWTPEEQKAFRENLLDHLARQVAAGALERGRRATSGS